MGSVRSNSYEFIFRRILGVGGDITGIEGLGLELYIGYCYFFRAKK